MSSTFAYTAKLAECGSKHLAMYMAIRDAIADGLLKPGERLPSTRALAALYGLSRGSVSLAYEMLMAEGFVQTGVGQGTFVAGSAAQPRNASRERTAEPDLSKWGRRLEELRRESGSYGAEREQAENGGGISFVPQGLGPSGFPWTEWKSAVARQWKSFGERGKDGEFAPSGSLQLRQAIAGRLRRERGIPCGEENIVITSGSMQAIALLAQLLLEEGRSAVVENPGYAGLRQAIRTTGATVIPQSIDEGGIVVRDWDAELLFVTPTRQFPTGVVLSYERRRKLLDWASRRNAWIVEDDYDSDFRWGGRPIEPLKSLDREDRVVYVGTFSRSMFAGLRIGFAVVPKALLRAFLLAKKLYDPYPTGIAEQQALGAWMNSGGYDRHVRKTRRALGKLEGKLRDSLERQLEGLFAAFPSDAGLHVYATWEGGAEAYGKLVRECEKLGVRWRDGAAYENRGEEACDPRKPSALFGFAHLDAERIEDGMARIRRAAENLKLVDRRSGQGGILNA
ncbi:PLP-dependent aminotransferase family protein [Paenibacillaceae bacterium WGS1546]|uniref:MocR-like pyridoxine biosynthesis transcription factor PdxR n=1 Tax=Cohnella sp. WGS1546 TaxID=3366810 RepID=UPI00372D53CF